MNSIGRIFRVSSWGESHGVAIGCILDGCPSNLGISEEDIQRELDKRRPGCSDIGTERVEEDKVRILSGVFENKTTGAPISMLIQNKDIDSSKYSELKNKPRPGHADLSWREKFGWVDWRGGGRGSGRETASRVAAGAIAKKLLKEIGIEVIAHPIEIAGIRSKARIEEESLEEIRRLIDSSPVRAADPDMGKEMESAIKKAKKEKDSVGGIIEAMAFGIPPGLGEPVFGKLDADIAYGMMSIPAVKGVELGAGFSLAKMKGSQANDPFTIDKGKIITKSNNSGGILGGISNGMPILVRIAVKPTSSIGKEQETVDLNKMKDTKIEIEGRHDPCIVPRAVPVVEAMISLTLADHSMLSGIIPRRLK